MGPGLGEKGRRVLECPGFPASSFLDYMAPGVVTMVTLFGGIFGGMSIVWDRRLDSGHKRLGPAYPGPLPAAELSQGQVRLGPVSPPQEARHGLGSVSVAKAEDP